MEFNLRSVDLNLLPVFEAAYEERSLSRAAVRLGMTQPAMSHALNRLRLTFKDELFIRHPRGMTPTPLADMIYPRLSHSLNEARKAILDSSAFDPSHSARRFNIAIPHPLGPLIALRLLQRLALSAPLFEVIFSTRSRPIDMLRDMHDGRVDLAIDWLLLHEQQIRAEVLFLDRLEVLARKTHPLQGKVIALTRLQQQGFVGLRSRSELGYDIPAFREWLGFDLDVRLEVSELLEVLLTVSRSDLLGLMPHSMRRIAEDDFQSKALQFTGSMPGEFPIYMSWHERREHDPAHCFLRQQIIGVMGEILAENQ
jgi:DNA-binding transcriptional LysR family regulator